jgi:hypothetical protein
MSVEIPLPPGWEVVAQKWPSAPRALLRDGALVSELGPRDDPAAKAWRMEVRRLAMSHDQCPTPCPLGMVRALVDLSGGPTDAARVLRVGVRTVFGWCAGRSNPSHAQCEILRLAIVARWP